MRINVTGHLSASSAYMLSISGNVLLTDDDDILIINAVNKQQPVIALGSSYRVLLQTICLWDRGANLLPS